MFPVFVLQAAFRECAPDLSCAPKLTLDPNLAPPNPFASGYHSHGLSSIQMSILTRAFYNFAGGVQRVRAQSSRVQRRYGRPARRPVGRFGRHGGGGGGT